MTKYHIQKLIERLRPYQDVILFMVTLFVANYFWKWTVSGDENGDIVTWFGVDVTALFDIMATHVASAVYWLVSLIRETAYMPNDYTIRFQTGSGTTIIWGCTGIKQSFIWLCLILTARCTEPSMWKHKLWFIPLGWLCCYAFNILRIAVISLFLEYHPDWFTLLHDYIFKYMFYAMLFGLWVWFVNLQSETQNQSK